MRSRLPEMAIASLGHFAIGLDDPRYQARKRRLRVKSRFHARHRLENVLAVGNWLYDAIRLIERTWRDEVLEGKTPYDQGEERSIMELYQQWTVPCRRCLDEIDWFKSKGFPVRGERAFRKHGSEVSEILSGDKKPFEDAEQSTLWAALTANTRPNPRMVRVDEHGLIFEMTGQRFVMPGLEPEDVLQGIADAESGRVRPLKDIISARDEHGV